MIEFTFPKNRISELGLGFPDDLGNRSVRRWEYILFHSSFPPSRIVLLTISCTRSLRHVKPAGYPMDVDRSVQSTRDAVWQNDRID